MRGQIIEIQEMCASGLPKCRNYYQIYFFQGDSFESAIPGTTYFSLFIIFFDAAFKLKEKQQ